MAGETIITVVGRLCADPELRYTPQGTAVVKARIADTPRYFDKKQGAWVDGETSFWDVVAFKTLAENIAESLVQGLLVIVHGKLETRTWKDADGDHKSKVEIVASRIGPDLSYATAKVTKTPRASEGTGTVSRHGGGDTDQWNTPAHDDPPF